MVNDTTFPSVARATRAELSTTDTMFLALVGRQAALSPQLHVRECLSRTLR